MATPSTPTAGNMIRVTIYKLEDPNNKYTWWRKEFNITCNNDLLKITGVMGEYVHYIIEFSNNDNADLLRKALNIKELSETININQTLKRLFEVTHE